MVKARTLWPGVESPPAPTGQGAEHPVYPCQSNCISSPDCHLLNDPSNKVDTVIALDVLEHFEDDSRIIKMVRDHLRTGGNLVIKVPAQAHLFGEIDRASGHYRRYDGADLDALLRSEGFEPQMMKPMNPVGAILYRLRGGRNTNFSRTFSPAILRLANAAIPLLSALDSLPISKGQSILAAYRYAG